VKLAASTAPKDTSVALVKWLAVDEDDIAAGGAAAGGAEAADRRQRGEGVGEARGRGGRGGSRRRDDGDIDPRRRVCGGDRTVSCVSLLITKLKTPTLPEIDLGDAGQARCR